MEHYSEKISYPDPLQPVRVLHEFRNDAFEGKWHCHQELELIAVLSGSYSIYTRDCEFRMSAGDVAVMGSLEPHHSGKAAGEMEYVVLQFDPLRYMGHDTLAYMRYFTETGSLYGRMNAVLRENPALKADIFGKIQEISSEFRGKTLGYEIAVHGLIYQMILLLLRNDRQASDVLVSHSEVARLMPVLAYVDTEIQQKIEMKTAARLVNMDYCYFGKFFKKSTGHNFNEYVNRRKIRCAERILLTQDVSVLDTAAMVGLPNMSHFNKLFYRYHQCAPGAYRRRYRGHGTDQE